MVLPVGSSTAVMATYGTEKPVIAILGEYDALPGLSQAAKPIKEPLVDGAPGHGCGHNLSNAWIYWSISASVCAAEIKLTSNELGGV